ncbi:preprotein translocase subunit SecY [Rhodanobacter sp. Root179]|uniref:preprotein translocase subunit SecY n=1 Tax=unclassified Rhodanobacter TaxID=2621553 RepID=UPI0006F700AB|nr:MULTISPECIES: preprotein translocase subunit SecY [unclassified Rhodanobacter]KQZ80106.1 preprotein translocase subunit SecY [Rhodanobacter sp. Root561]KRB53393.1 preprotein translocase subunit SecY [Rhodanobacter sp. Root179]QRP64802.1 preprotein translocase subunit SecY [Rhodanobacter sp. FDAARGOS 1247]
MAAAKGNALGKLGKLTELRQRIFFVIGALVVFRLGSFIPVPGVNPEAMTSLVSGNGLMDMFNMFSGGALARFSVFALGVIPYISASIVFQMMGAVVPSLQALRKEGESGKRKMTMYTRYATVALAAFQSFGIAVALQGQVAAGGAPVVYTPGFGFVLSSVVGLTAGTMFLMWLGEQMTERGVGNGISLLIFAGIVAGLPGAVVHTLGMASNGELSLIKLLMVFGLALAVTAFVVFMERAQRRITVNYARRSGGQKAYMNQSSNLPLKINMSGVIPPIFASSLLMFPATAVSWFSTGQQSRWVQDLVQALSPGNPLYEIVFSVLVIGFAFFYTAIVFNADETADNLKRSGALIPGIRPGKGTANYIDAVMTRLTGVGALYLVLVCLVPSFMQSAWHVPFYFGGTSLLIVVVVVMDFTSQVQAHLVSHQYESLLKKANLRRN